MRIVVGYFSQRYTILILPTSGQDVKDKGPSTGQTITHGASPSLGYKVNVQFSTKCTPYAMLNTGKIKKFGQSV